MKLKRSWKYRLHLTKLYSWLSTRYAGLNLASYKTFIVTDDHSDFVYAPGSGFTFTQGYISESCARNLSLIKTRRLIRSGAAVPFTAHATSPTITMPRLKAILTGSIPSFLDVILNFAESDTTSSLTNQDNWLLQFETKTPGKLIMYGDDTWLKLFPNVFFRAEGTSSFFVSVGEFFSCNFMYK